MAQSRTVLERLMNEHSISVDELAGLATLAGFKVEYAMQGVNTTLQIANAIASAMSKRLSRTMTYQDLGIVVLVPERGCR